MAKETGRVLESGEACIFVEFASGGKSVEFVVDTGFNGTLCIPQWLASELNLQPDTEVQANAVGTQKVIFGLTTTEITWLEEKRKVEVLINDGEDVLLGTEMLRGAVLRINYQNRRLTVRN